MLPACSTPTPPLACFDPAFLCLLSPVSGRNVMAICNSCCKHFLNFVYEPGRTGGLESVVPEPLPPGFPHEEDLLWVLGSGTSPFPLPFSHGRLCPHSKGSVCPSRCLHSTSAYTDKLSGSHSGRDAQRVLKKKLLLSDATCSKEIISEEKRSILEPDRVAHVCHPSTL